MTVFDKWRRNFDDSKHNDIRNVFIDSEIKRIHIMKKKQYYMLSDVTKFGVAKYLKS